MKSMRSLSVVLAFVMGLPGEMETYVCSRRLPEVGRSIVGDSRSKEVFLKAGSDQTPMSFDQVIRCEFDEGADLLDDTHRVLVWPLSEFVWPLPIAEVGPTEKPLSPYHPICSWRLLGHFRC